LDIKKNFFYDEGGETLEQVARRSCGCPPSPEVFKVRLDRALSNLIQ